MTEWLDKPAARQYEAAEAYLQLLCDKNTAKRLGAALRRAHMGESRATDIWRASGGQRPVVSRSIEDPFSPLLLVATPIGLWIADGYDTLCTIVAEVGDARVPRKLVYYDPWRAARQ